jgi:hypothetical protein
MSYKFIAGLALILRIAGAQTGAVGGPVVGYVLEPAAQAVRPILGVPGAALMGSRMALGFEPAAAALSPRQDYVLAVDAADGCVNLVELGRGAPMRRVIEGARPGAVRIVLSPAGGAAALLYSGAPGVQLLKGLPADPTVAGTADLSGLPGELGAVAVSDDGALLAAAGGSLFAVAPGGDPVPIPFTGQASSIVFAAGTRDALVAGREDNQIALLRDVTGRAEYRLLAGANDGIDSPVGLAISGRRALVASAGNGAITIIGMDGGAAASVACGCEVTGLERLNGASLFRVSEMGAGPLWMLDDGAGDPRLLFVPEEVAQ